MKKIIYLFLLNAVFSFAQSGDNDLSFNPDDIGFGAGDGANNNVFATVQQPDGKFIIGGTFTSFNAHPRNRITRINADGSLDETFNPSLDNNVETIALQPDAKIIIAGNFTSFSRNRIARLNSDGTLDASFNPGTGADAIVRTLAVQSDGKIIIAGEFTNFNGVAVNRIVRLNVDGTMDLSFNIGTGASNRILSMVLQPDGKIIVVGDFTSYNGTPRVRIARLNTDGTLDATFNSGGSGANNTINSIALQPDGKFVIGGNFTNYITTARNRIARLNSDGTIDLSFNPGTGATTSVLTTALQPDGKIIIGGGFLSYNGNTRNRIARLNPDGSLDISFNPGTGASANVNVSYLQTDGKIIIGGAFTSYNGTVLFRLTRLNSDGTLDIDFNPQTGANDGGIIDGTLRTSILAAILQPDEKIIIAGTFTSYNGTLINRVARLNSDGSLDLTFNPGTGANVDVRSLALQPDGKILIAGNFNTYNGTSRNRIARLNSDGTLDASFIPGTAANSIVRTLCLQPDGKILIGGNFTSYNGTSINRIARLNSNGTLDLTFNPGTGANLDVRSIILQPDGKILVGGRFSNFNGTLTNSIVRLNSNGTTDSSFSPGTGANQNILAIALQPDGKIIIAGFFTAYNGITTANRIARLNIDGTLDASFNTLTGTGGDILALAIQPDGKIIIGGGFSAYSGIDRRRIARVNVDGSIDLTFDPGTGAFPFALSPTGTKVETIALQPDGKIIIGGNFTSYNGRGRNRITRLNNTFFLPVELKLFEAKRVNNEKVILNWATETETNNRGFWLQRWLDSENEFQNIAWIDGAGTSSTTQTYNFEDINPHSGISYYRLIQTDFDGTENASQVVAVEGIKIKRDVVLLYPVPAAEFAYLSFGELPQGISTATIQVTDISGRKVYECNHAALSNTQIKIEDLASWAAGIYWLQVKFDNGDQQMIEFSKK